MRKLDTNTVGALTCFMLLLAILPVPGHLATSEPAKQVLLIYSYFENMPWQVSLRKGIHAELGKQSRKFQVFEEEIDATRTAGPEPAIFREYLRNKYREIDFDIVVYFGGPASSYYQAWPDLFPGKPTIVAGADVVERLRKEKSVHLVQTRENIAAAFDSALNLSGSKSIYIIGETQTSIVKEMVNVLQHERPSVRGQQITYLLDNDLDALLTRVKNLPPSSIIFYLSIFRDSKGRPLIPRDVVDQLTEVANAPVFVYYDSLFGKGALGGLMISAELVGEYTAREIVKTLAGQETPAEPVKAPVFVPLAHIYDSRILKRFGISEKRLAEGSLVRNP